MENMHLSESGTLVGEEGESKVMPNPFKEQVGPGELIWIKLKRDSWWPAQVVNENSISDSNKPRKKSGGKVLVRLYGSYKYLYTSPVKCDSEFQTVLNQKNGNFFEILQKSLEQDLPSLKRGRNIGQGSKQGTNGTDGKRSNRNAAREAKVKITQAVRQPFTSKSNANNTEAKSGQNRTNRSNKHGVSQQKQKSKGTGNDSYELGVSDAKKHKSLGKKNATTSPATPKEVSARKTRVMQALGLIGPSGSPFRRNGTSSVVSD